MAHQTNRVNEQIANPQTNMDTCIEYGVDHLGMHYPHRQVPTQQLDEINAPFFPIERYCVGCCEEHLPKDYLLRPKEDKGKDRVPFLYASVQTFLLTYQDENEAIPL